MSGEYNPSPEGNPSFLARRNRFQTALVKFIGRHTPKCREVVRILSRSMDSKLSFHDASQAPPALPDLCLVPAIREAVARLAQDRLIRSGSRRRVFSGCAFVHCQGTDEGCASPKIAVSDSSRWSATKIAEVIRSRELSCESRRDLRSILHAIYFVTD